jgi:RHH-type rel operon transcriptional repressor/antitoxin RelB
MMPTSVRLNAKVERRLDRLVDLTGRSKAFYLRKLIEEHIGDLEDYYLAAETLERVRSGKEKTVSQKELERRLGVDD